MSGPEPPTTRAVAVLDGAEVLGTTHQDTADLDAIDPGVAVFKGIRYATAERFAPPERVVPAGRIDATRYGPQCPQLPGTLERLLGGSSLPTGEDCLVLNVTTPSCDGRRRPVLVWFHGGAFVTGGGAMPWYHGAALARRGDVVVVTCNYRLGALGFTGTSNAGLADQIAALGWVRDHVEAFGGDPSNVTVFGESAGGASVLALLAAPAARDLFTAAFAMSPSITQLRDVERAHEAQRSLTTAAGADLDELRHAPIDVLLDAQRQVLADPAGSFTAFAPTPDGTLLPGPVLDAVATDPRPLVIGTTRDEMHLFTAFDERTAALDEDGLHRGVRQRLGDRADDAIQRYRDARPGSGPGQLLSAVQTDQTFRAPADRLARARSAAGVPTWVYWFTWPTPAFQGQLGSCHGLDIPFAFHNLGRPGVEMFTGDGADRVAVADAFSDALLALAHRGEPGWTAFHDQRRATWRLDETSMLLEDPERHLLELWDPR